MKTTIFFLLIFGLKTYGAAYEPLVMWEKSRLKICFNLNRSTLSETELRNERNAKKEYEVYPRQLSSGEQSRVSKFLSEIFKKDTTGIEFVVDKSCNDFDVLVIRNAPPVTFGPKKKKYGRASIGEAGIITYRGRGFFSKKPGFYEKSGYKTYVALGEVDRITTLHEFGHIAGLRHEHARDEAYDDKGCFMENRPSAGRDSSLRESLYKTTELIGSYDPNSFMNYCYINRERKAINAYQLPALSNRDKSALKSIYQDL